MSRKKGIAKKKPEIRKVLDGLMGLFTEHNGCCLELGTLFNRIQERFEQAGGGELLEAETRSLKGLAAKESSICYRMGRKYNELSQLLGREAAEALIEDDPRLSFTDVILYGKVAEQFSELQIVGQGIHKMVQLVEYAALNRMTLGEADPGATQISLLQNDGRWKSCRLRDCSVDELGQTVIAIKAQRGIPVDDPFDSFDLD